MATADIFSLTVVFLISSSKENFLKLNFLVINVIIMVSQRGGLTPQLKFDDELENYDVDLESNFFNFQALFFVELDHYFFHLLSFTHIVYPFFF